MKPLHYLPLLAGLCGIATYAGMTLAEPGRWTSSAETPGRNAPAAPTPANVVTVRQILDGPGPSLLARKITKESTEDLWKELGKASSYTGDDREIATELLERLGIAAAMRHALDTADTPARADLSQKILSAYAGKDIWAAYEIYKREREAFDASWCAASIPPYVMSQACLISADKLIECMDVCSSLPVSDGFTASFAPGFDFRKVIDYFDRPGPRSGPGNLLEGWAAVDPVAAVSWRSKDRPFGRGLPGLVKKVGWPTEDLMTAIIEGQAPADEKRQALQLLPEWDRGQAWEAIRDDEWTLSGRDGGINPKLLEVADAFKNRDDYLTARLLATRGVPELSPSWNAVPEAEREPAIQRALAQWTAEEPTPLGDETRRQWVAWLRKSWEKP